jgi:hypothetical protein
MIRLKLMVEKSAQIGRKILMAKGLDSKFLRVNELRARNLSPDGVLAPRMLCSDLRVDQKGEINCKSEEIFVDAFAP